MNAATSPPITLRCRVCSKLLTVTDTNEALAHVMGEHSNALIMCAALGSLYLNSHLFDGFPDGSEAFDRWERNIKNFYSEFQYELQLALAGEAVPRMEQVFGKAPLKMNESDPNMFGGISAAPATDAPRPHRAGRPR